MDESPVNNSFWAFLNKKANLYWKGYCNKDRNIAIYEIENIINSFGYITDSRMYSDIEMCFKLEIEERKIPDLYSKLNSYLTLNEFKSIKSVSEVERILLINITFTKGTGNLKIEVPAIPG